MPAFNRYIGIDYSGAEVPTAYLKGLRVYMTDGQTAPAEVSPPRTPGRNWTRRGVAEWLVERLREDTPTLIGIDHGFSFPLSYFDAHRLAHDWDAFLDDFQRHWPTDGDNIYVDFVREGVVGNGAARRGDTRWRRLTEHRAGGAKSVFHFDVPGSVAKSTHSGIPWLRFIRRQLRERVHVWPFDGWDIPAGRSAVVEAYPALWSAGFANDVGRTNDQHDAFCIAAWLSQADRDGRLAASLKPGLSGADEAVAKVEGWILGVPAAGTPGRATSNGRSTPRSGAGGTHRRLAGANEPRASAARYDPASGKVTVDLTNGCAFIFPARALQGLESATDAQLAQVQVLGAGIGLHWESLDADFSVPGLLMGRFGTEAWMA